MRRFISVATLDEAQQSILDLIVETAETKPTSGQPDSRNGVHKAQGEAILKLAEAYAWLESPRQSHTA